MASEMLGVYIFVGSAITLAAIYFLLRLAMQGPRAQTCLVGGCGKHAFEWIQDSPFGAGWVCGDHARQSVDFMGFSPAQALPKTKAVDHEQVRCEVCQRPSAWFKSVKNKDGKETTKTVRKAGTFIRFNGGYAHSQCVPREVPS